MSNTALTLTKLKSLVEEFEANFKNRTKNQDDFLTLKELETLWGKLRGDTNVLYSDMLQGLLEDIDEKDIIRKKKESTQPKESDCATIDEQKKTS